MQNSGESFDIINFMEEHQADYFTNTSRTCTQHQQQDYSDIETLGTFLTNWTILLQYFYGLMPWQQLMRKHPSDARFLPAGITGSAVPHSTRRFRVKIERDRRLLKKIEKTEKRLKSSKVNIMTLLFFSLNERSADNRSITC